MASLTGRGLHGQLVNALGLRIIRGEIPSGGIIDVEALMTEFSMSRTVVREALKSLTAKGLIGARPKHGTFVTERAQWQLLDVDVMRWRTEDVLDPRLVVELDQVRAIVEPPAAAIAALGRTEAQLAAVEEALERMVTAFEVGDHATHIDHDVAFHLAVLAAAGNELLERFEVVLEPALRARHTLAAQHAKSPDFLTDHRAIYEALASRDADAARERSAALIRRSAREIAEILGTGAPHDASGGTS